MESLFWAGEESRNLDISYNRIGIGSVVVFDRTGDPELDTNSHVILELNSPRRVELNLLESLSHDIIRLIFTLLGGFDGSSFIQVTLVIDIESLEGVGQ